MEVQSQQQSPTVLPSTHWRWITRTVWTGGGHVDKVWKQHFAGQPRQETGINEIKYFMPLFDGFLIFIQMQTMSGNLI
jgi:hypothetical protein